MDGTRSSRFSHRKMELVLILSRSLKPARVGTLISLDLRSKSGMMHVVRVTSIHYKVDRAEEPGGPSDKANGFRQGPETGAGQG